MTETKLRRKTRNCKCHVAKGLQYALFMRTTKQPILAIACALAAINIHIADAQSKTLIVVGQPLIGSVRTNGSIVHLGLPRPPYKDSIVAGRSVAQISVGVWVDVPEILGDRVSLLVSDLGGRIVARRQLEMSANFDRKVRLSRTAQIPRGLYAVVLSAHNSEHVERLVVWID